MVKHKDGRRNRYQIQVHMPLREAAGRTPTSPTRGPRPTGSPAPCTHKSSWCPTPGTTRSRSSPTSPPPQSCASWNRSRAVPRAGHIRALRSEEARRIAGEVTLSRNRNRNRNRNRKRPRPAAPCPASKPAPRPPFRSRSGPDQRSHRVHARPVSPSAGAARRPPHHPVAARPHGRARGRLP
jgi:hypothetical protein